MRTQTLITQNWLFKRGFAVVDAVTPELTGYQPVALPHTVEELPLNYFDETCYQQHYCYQYLLDDALCRSIGETQSGYLLFEGVMTYSEVYVNGQLAGSHKGGYTPFEIRIDHLLQDSNNRITVMVDCRERDDIPPFGGQIDYLTYGGIYRDVHFLVTDSHSLTNLRIATPEPLAETKQVVVDCFLRNAPEVGVDVHYSVELQQLDGSLIAKSEQTVPYDNRAAQLTLSDLSALQLWQLDDPCLYQITVTMTCGGSQDTLTQRFGFRAAEFTADGFFLNGEKLAVLGVNRHQSMAYLGYAFGARRQRWDADYIKESGFNLARCSHYPQSKAFLDRCDEIGLLVFEEIPGWQHIGGQEWQDQVVEDVRLMIERDWNHPSIVLWGVRINESQDNHDLYTRTNELARALDPTRQTGGVRYLENSEMLEDVYTMNDFVLNGGPVALREPQQVTGLEKKVPYLVTEYNGHMFPTKRFDAEEHQHEHVIRHLRVMDAMYGDDGISGCITWCLFDYNTHKDFGAGDRICYHGVNDIHRIPKFAASAYSSQMPVEKGVIMEPVSFWARGERAECMSIPMMILTNCDYIEFEFGDYPAKRVYPDKDLYPNLPHPPVVVDQRHISNADVEAWGMAWLGGRIRGFVGDEVVAERVMLANPVPAQISVEIDDTELSADVKDLTRVVFKGLDAVGNLLPFWNPVLNLNLTGPARIVGPKQMSLQGGVAATYIETRFEPGQVELTLSVEGFADQTVGLTVF